MTFNKKELEILKNCIENQIFDYVCGMFPQDVETTERIEREKLACKKLLCKIEFLIENKAYNG